MNYDDLGKRIRLLRKQRGMTQEQLANETGMSPSFIGHIERGTRKVSLDTLSLIAEILGVSGSGLMDEIPKKTGYAETDAGRSSYHIGDAVEPDGMLMEEDPYPEEYLYDDEEDLQAAMLRELVILLSERD